MIMILIHLTAVIFFLPALIITIPLHLILNAVSKNNNSKKESGLNKFANWMTNSAKSIEDSRHPDVNSGKRSMTFAEGWSEIKAYPMAYAVQVSMMIVVAVAITKFAIAYL